MRDLTAPELAALKVMGGRIGNDDLRQQFFTDLEGVTVDEQASEGARLIFHIPGLERGPYKRQDTFRGADRFPVEGTVEDADGASVEVYIYQVDGRVYELETLRPDANPLLKPNWETFKPR